MKPYPPRILPTACAALLAFALPFASALHAGEAKPATQDKPKPKPKDETKPKPKDEAKPKTQDEANRLLAEAERQRGPTFAGNDPAFLILPRQVERSQTALELLTPEITAASQKALDYLLKIQNADGSWSDKNWPRNTGVTALCCLALMADGNAPRVGRSGKALDRGLEFLLKNSQENGIIAGEGSNHYGPMYEHAFSTLALIYAYGQMPWQPGLRDRISKALQAMQNCQRLDGGWRYSISKEGSSDLSITGKVLWVLRTAKKSGFTVDAQVIAKGVKYVEQCALPDGTFRYRNFGLHAEPSLGGVAIVALANSGNLDHELIGPARDRIAYEYQRYSVAELKNRRYFIDGAFHASIAMYGCGESYYTPWFKKTAACLLAAQERDGQFSDRRGNETYVTAMAAMLLLSPKNLLPLYER